MENFKDKVDRLVGEYIVELEQKNKELYNKRMGVCDRVYELEEENKNLNKQIEQFKKGVKAGTKIIERLEEENRKLKEQIERMKTDTMYDMEDINSLYKENKNLKEELSKLKEKYGDIDY